MPPQPQLTREQFIDQLFQLREKDNIYSDHEARVKLFAGIGKIVDAISTSYGAAGSNAVIESDLYPFHKIVNDGKAIAESIKLQDPVENMGANIAKETADKSDKISGDGRKTSLILLGAILQEGMKHKVSPMELKRSLDDCLDTILNSLDEETKDIKAEDIGAIATIATIASESETLGKVFEEIYRIIGKDGIVNLDNSGTPDTHYEIIEGVRLLGAGFHYPYMVNEDKGRQAVYNYPKILITKQKLGNINELDKILKTVSGNGRDELVIFCDEIDPNVSGALAYLHHGQTPQGKPIQSFKTLVIKAPTLWKDWMFEDFARITGASIIGEPGKTLKNFKIEYLGNCDKIMTSKEETVVLGIKDISNHLKVLEDLNTDDSKIRIARLRTKTATLKLGANSESELSYIRGKALDARNASFLALNGGVVIGGGIALLHASRKLPDTIGGKILREALKYPFKVIVTNFGKEPTEILNMMEGEIEHEGFDAKQGRIVDMWEAGILDPATVVKNSIINALSVASMVLTTKAVVTRIK